MKVFVDTNILLNEKFSFSDYESVKIAITSIEELDNLKSHETKGYLARQAIRNIKNANNVEIKYNFSYSGVHKFLDNKNDNRILGFAYEVCMHKDHLFLTDDYAVFLKAETLGIPCSLFEYEGKEIELYTGIKEIDLDEEEYKHIEVLVNQYNLYPNQYLIITKPNDRRYLYMWTGEYLKEVKASSITNSYLSKDKILPLDIYQRAFMHMLQNDDVKIKITDSPYGSGKSYLMLNWSLQMIEKKKYKKILFIKSDSPPKNRKEFPAIPGGIVEKCDPLLGVIGDSIEGKNVIKTLIDEDKLEIIPIQFVQGRSIRNSILFINESQNFTPSEMEGLLSRVGEGTVVLLDGSTKQINNKFCFHKNGLTVASENFKDKHNSAQVNMVEDYRSELCKMVSQMDWSD